VSLDGIAVRAIEPDRQMYVGLRLARDGPDNRAVQPQNIYDECFMRKNG
jgi:hypothetical protein